MLAQFWFNVISTLAQHHVGTMLIQCCLHFAGSMLVQCHINIGPAPHWHNVDPMLSTLCWLNVGSMSYQHWPSTILAQCCLHFVGSMLVQSHINIDPTLHYHVGSMLADNVGPISAGHIAFTLVQHCLHNILVQSTLSQHRWISGLISFKITVGLIKLARTCHVSGAVM